MRYWLVMPAAGAGTRFGERIPKQYAALRGRTVIEWALAPFLADGRCAGAAVALASGDTWWPKVAERIPAVTVCQGGAERSESVRNALLALNRRAGKDDWVLVHDAARPCLPAADLDRLVTQVCPHPVGGILALPVADTLKRALRADGVPNAAASASAPPPAPGAASTGATGPAAGAAQPSAAGAAASTGTRPAPAASAPIAGAASKRTEGLRPDGVPNAAASASAPSPAPGAASTGATGPAAGAAQPSAAGAAASTGTRPAPAASAPMAGAASKAAAPAGAGASKGAQAAGAPAIEVTIDRAGLWRAGTPQMFRFGLLLAALETALAAKRFPTDESQALEWQGYQPLLIEGSTSNIKVTTPADLALAESLLAARGSKPT